VKLGVDGGLFRVGYRKSRAIIFSVIRERTEVTEIGRKSLGCLGPGVFGTGQNWPPNGTVRRFTQVGLRID